MREFFKIVAFLHGFVALFLLVVMGIALIDQRFGTGWAIVAMDVFFISFFGLLYWKDKKEGNLE